MKRLDIDFSKATRRKWKEEDLILKAKEKKDR